MSNSKLFQVRYMTIKQTSMSLVKTTPNILILADKQETFTGLKVYLKSIFGSNSFTIYNLNTKDLNKTTAWMSNCALLIDTVNLEPSNESFSDYLKKGGTILSVISSDHAVLSEQLNDNSPSPIKSYLSQKKHFVTKVNLNFMLSWVEKINLVKFLFGRFLF